MDACYSVAMFGYITLYSVLASLVRLGHTGGHANLNTLVYSPLRPPSIPLAVRSPYSSAWSTTHNGSTLNSRNVTFWTGNTIGWTGIIRVDSQSYEFMGDSPSISGLQKAVPSTVSYDSHYSNFTFDAGPLRVTASFFSPVLPKDLCRSSVPVSYLEVSYSAMDEKSHDVQVYSDVNGMWLANGELPIKWELDCPGICSSPLHAPDATYHWHAEITQPLAWADRKQDAPTWGRLHYISSAGTAAWISSSSKSADQLRYDFVSSGNITDQYVDPGQPRLPTNHEPVFGFAHGFPASQSGSVLYTVGTTQTPAINYRTSTGNVELRPWWATGECYGGEATMLETHYQSYRHVQNEAAKWETQLKSDVASFYANEDKGNPDLIRLPSTAPGWQSGTDQFGQDFVFNSDTSLGYLTPNLTHGIAIPFVSEEDAHYALLALSTRQILAANVLTESRPNSSSPAIFEKEVSSDGKTNTVDVIYPALPFYLYANPELLRLLLQPVFEYQEAGLYKAYGDFAMHDIGRYYPNAVGYDEENIRTDEAMPMEESADMLILAYAYFKFTGDVDYLSSHYKMLRQWGEYLLTDLPFPHFQQSTDDFSTRLSNNTNLALKGITALSALSCIAQVLQIPADVFRYASLSTDLYGTWFAHALHPRGTHVTLTYHHRSSFTTLYNMYPALLLNLSIIPSSLYTLQSDFYPSVSQLYGVPLDSREAWAKSDWEMWAAACSAPRTRRLFVNALARWVNQTGTDMALTDHYMTTGDGGYTDYAFVARSVVGGHFALLALDKARKMRIEGGA